MAIDITKEREDYSDSLPDWVLVRDTLRGETHIKKKGEVYLTKSSGQIYAELEDPVNGPKIYESYKHKAEFYDAVSSAHRSMVSTAHEAEPEITLPPVMEYILTKATKDGRPLEEFAKRVTREILTSGRCPTLVDASSESDGGDPYLINFRAETMPSWLPKDRYVLKLNKSEVNGKGEVDSIIYYKELLMLDGEYHQRLWNIDREGKYVVTEDIVITELDFIPMVVAGSVDITDDIDEVPLLPMAKATIACYQMSADHRHTLYMCSQPTPYGSGVDDNEKPKAIGSSTFIALANPQSRLGYLEISGAGISAQADAIKVKKEEADMSGLKVQGAGAGESTESIKMRQMAKHATLKSAVKAGGEAIEAQLKNIAIWWGADPDAVSYSPNMDFADVQMDNATFTALGTMVNLNKIPVEFLWEYCRASGITKLDNDTIAGMIEGSDNDLDEE
jgi:hypothetical protein